MPLQNDRRRHRRKEINTLVLVLDGKGNIVKGKSVNISLFGMLFEAKMKLKLEDEVQLHFFLSGSKELLVCVGTVKWILPLADGVYYNGINFTELGKHEILSLRSLAER